jgi:hypothetical protein
MNRSDSVGHLTFYEPKKLMISPLFCGLSPTPRSNYLLATSLTSLAEHPAFLGCGPCQQRP